MLPAEQRIDGEYNALAMVVVVVMTMMTVMIVIMIMMATSMTTVIAMINGGTVFRIIMLLGACVEAGCEMTMMIMMIEEGERWAARGGGYILRN